MAKNTDQQIAKEAVFGILPVMPDEKLYGLLDAFLILSGYFIATRTLVPLLFVLGLVVIFVGFTSVPFDAIWNYKHNTRTCSLRSRFVTISAIRRDERRSRRSHYHHFCQYYHHL
jgi:hypothetical protein